MEERSVHDDDDDDDDDEKEYSSSHCNFERMDNSHIQIYIYTIYHTFTHLRVLAKMAATAPIRYCIPFLHVMRNT